MTVAGIRLCPFRWLTTSPPIVGANESGKSQILAALKVALTGAGAERHDFCRYSKLFIVDRPMRLPDFGVTLGSLDDQARATLAGLCGLDVEGMPDGFTLKRGGNNITHDLGA